MKEVKITVEKIDSPACSRCWRHVETDFHIYWPEDRVCPRCVWTLLESIEEYPPYKTEDGKRIYITEVEALSGK